MPVSAARGGEWKPLDTESRAPLRSGPRKAGRPVPDTGLLRRRIAANQGGTALSTPLTFGQGRFYFLDKIYR